MIVAIASEGGKVAQHFGRCPGYTLYEVDNGKITEKKEIANPGHEPGFLPRYLADMGVEGMIAGGMGPRAQALFAERGIETCVGIEGPVDEVIEGYITGNLNSGVSACDHNFGAHSCD